MPKVLAKSGDSLADVYDIKGSIAGIEELISRDVSLTHEMGATIHSERLSGTILNVATGVLAQNIAFNTGFTIGQTPTRLLGVRVLTDVASRVARVSVHITDVPPNINDMPLFAWATGDEQKTIDIAIDGSLLARNLLDSTTPTFVPNLLIGTDQQSPVPVITLRGLTSGFGAGTVNVMMQLYIAFPRLAGVSSRGLPIPSW